LFSQDENVWIYESNFSVVGIEDSSVILKRGIVSTSSTSYVSYVGKEGGRKYVAHWMRERDGKFVGEFKKSRPPICEICDQSFVGKYDVCCLEVHYKRAISTYESTHEVTSEDLALLCPNCSAATHTYMREREFDYENIRRILQERITE